MQTHDVEKTTARVVVVSCVSTSAHPDSVTTVMKATPETSHIC